LVRGRGWGSYVFIFWDVKLEKVLIFPGRSISCKHIDNCILL